MKIEAITVSVGYTHCLKLILENRHEVDRWVIVTHKDDIMTRRLCRKYDIEVAFSDRIFDDAKFAKGRAVNDGFKSLDMDDWVLHLDSDMLLPKDFKNKLKEHSSPESLNYVKRLFKGPIPHHLIEQSTTGMAPNTNDRDEVFWVCGGPIAPELSPKEYHDLNERLGFTEEWLNGPKEYQPRPYGYFQLWHVPTTEMTEYSEISKNADIDDVYTSYKFYPKWNLMPVDVYDLNPWDSTWDGPPRSILRNNK